MNSTIIRKKKQLKCGCFDYAFSKGRCKLHATVEDTKKRAEKYAAQPTVRKAGWFNTELTKTEDKGIRIMDKEEIDAFRKEEDKKHPKGGSELQRWFEDRRKEMTGKCDNCGGKTCKDDDKYYKFSIAHLLPKAYVKSVATHPKNFLELCHFGNGCHDQMDKKLLDLIDMNCFDKIVERVTEMYPHIAPEERRRIPAILREYIKSEL